MNIKTLTQNTLLACSVTALVACSSAGDSTTSTSTDSVTTTSNSSTTISGSIFAAPVNGADVSVEDTNGNTVAGPVKTAADGSYSIDVPDSALSSDLVFKSIGGAFIDEATGAGTDAGAMAAFVAGGSLAAGDSVHVTPGTTIHASLVIDYGTTATTAQSNFFGAFGYNPNISVQPVDITDPASYSASDLSRLAGFRAAVFSKLAMDVGLTAEQQFDMFAALARDLSDGDLDGLDASSNAVSIGTSADVLDDYMKAVDSFTDAASQTYKVTYTPPMMTTHGKSQFQITVKDQGGDAVTGLTTSGDLKLMPMMYMAAHNHSTPVGEISESATAGVYDVTVYYVMASRMGAMANFAAMGTWDLKVMIGMESVHFYPNVYMAMGDTVVTQLKAQSTGDDMVINPMTGIEEPRTYFVFRDDLTGSAGNYSFKLFLATRDTMMDFPAVDENETLDSASGPWTLTSVDVQISTDGATYTSTSNPTTTTGYFNGTGLDISSDKVYVKLTVDAEHKTTNSLPPDSETDPDLTNRHAVFTVTP